MLRVRQQQVQSPLTSAAFAFEVWVGTIGGSALPTDPDPNVTPPSAGRIIRIGSRRGGHVVSGQASVRFICPTVAGASITLAFWIYDDNAGRWSIIAGPTSLSPNGTGGNNQSSVNIGARLDQQVFVQITANTNTQALGYMVS